MVVVVRTGRRSGRNRRLGPGIFGSRPGTSPGTGGGTGTGSPVPGSPHPVRSRRVVVVGAVARHCQQAVPAVGAEASPEGHPEGVDHYSGAGITGNCCSACTFGCAASSACSFGCDASSA